MTYPQPYPQQQYTPPAAPPRPKSAGFAVTALVLGIIGVVLSFMPIVNNLTAAGAVVGLVFGVIGLWKSRIVMSSIGAFLCGLAVILTIVAQQQLTEELDKIGDDLSLPSAKAAKDVDTTAPPPPPEPAKYTPTAADWELDVVVTEQQCFGSAGCNVTLRLELIYLSTLESDDTATYELVYDVVGTEDALRGSMEITGEQYSTQDHFVMTTGPDVKLSAKVVSFEKLY